MSNSGMATLEQQGSTRPRWKDLLPRLHWKSLLPPLGLNPRSVVEYPHSSIFEEDTCKAGGKDGKQLLPSKKNPRVRRWMKVGDAKAKRDEPPDDEQEALPSVKKVHSDGPDIFIITKGEFLEREKENISRLGQGASSEIFSHPGPPPVAIRFCSPSGYGSIDEDEVQLAIHLGNSGVGPRIYEYRAEGNIDDYVVMELAGNPLSKLRGEERQRVLRASIDRYGDLSDSITT